MSEIEAFEVLGDDWRWGHDDQGFYVVAADVARSLDYRDAERATRLLDEDETGTLIVGTSQVSRRMKVIYEDGVWELIFRSSKPEAKAIKKRVKSILRQLREQGYVISETATSEQLERAQAEIQNLSQQLEASETEKRQIVAGVNKWQAETDREVKLQLDQKDERIQTILDNAEKHGVPYTKLIV